MARILLAGMLPLFFALAWFILRRPVREIYEEISFDRAREQFRMQRERLEARFLTKLDQHDPLTALRWDEACWHDEVVWARDRRSRRLLALIGVHFQDDEPFDDLPPRQATALFEYHKGYWTTEGVILEETRPDEALLLHSRLEPVIAPPQRRPSEAGGTPM